MLKSFEELSQSRLNYQEFEKIRQNAHAKSKKGLMIGGGIGGILLLIGIIILATGNASLGVILIIVGIAFFGIYYAMVNSTAKKQVKDKVIGDLVKSIDPTFIYSKGDQDFVENFKKTGFIYSTPNIYVDDVFRGEINGLQFNLGELRIAYEQDEDNDENITIYQGPFAFTTTSSNYSFTSIIPDKLEKSLGRLGKIFQKINISRPNQKNIRIDEDPDFEKNFAVWTKDETTTRQILNPQFRNYLTNLASMSKTYVGWRDDKIFFGMDNRKNLFELKLKNKISQSTVRQFYDDFAQYYNILENIISFVTTGIGAGGNTSATPGDVPPPPTNNNNETPPPPPPKPKF